LRGGEERPELGFGGGEVVEPRPWVGIEVDDGGVLGRVLEEERFLACKSRTGFAKTRQTYKESNLRMSAWE